jgi:hypothetical protein
MRAAVGAEFNSLLCPGADLLRAHQAHRSVALRDIPPIVVADVACDDEHQRAEAMSRQRGKAMLFQAGIGVIKGQQNGFRRTALQSSLAGRLVTPWKFAASLQHEGYLSGLMECFTAREFWYTLGWPLALGIWHLRDFPRPWLWASGAGVVIALILGAWNRAGGNTAPAMFDAAGALLCVSTADLLRSCVSRLDTRGG